MCELFNGIESIYFYLTYYNFRRGMWVLWDWIFSIMDGGDEFQFWVSAGQWYYDAVVCAPCAVSFRIIVFLSSRVRCCFIDDIRWCIILSYTYMFGTKSFMLKKNEPPMNVLLGCLSKTHTCRKNLGTDDVRLQTPLNPHVQRRHQTWTHPSCNILTRLTLTLEGRSLSLHG